MDSSRQFILELSPSAVSFFRARAEQVTQRHAITAQRDVELEKIRGFAVVMLAAIAGARETRAILIESVAAGMNAAIATGNTEVALELARVLGDLGRISADITEGYIKLTGRGGVHQS